MSANAHVKTGSSNGSRGTLGIPYPSSPRLSSTKEYHNYGRISNASIKNQPSFSHLHAFNLRSRSGSNLDSFCLGDDGDQDPKP
jgi:hypothetical protein